jgi:molybdopterin biosynthesis enzyme
MRAARRELALRAVDALQIGRTGRLAAGDHAIGDFRQVGCSDVMLGAPVCRTTPAVGIVGTIELRRTNEGSLVEKLHACNAHDPARNRHSQYQQGTNQ